MTMVPYKGICPHCGHDHDHDFIMFRIDQGDEVSNLKDATAKAIERMEVAERYTIILIDEKCELIQQLAAANAALKWWNDGKRVDLEAELAAANLKNKVLKNQLEDEKNKIVNVSYFDNHTSLEE